MERRSTLGRRSLALGRRPSSERGGGGWRRCCWDFASNSKDISTLSSGVRGEPGDEDPEDVVLPYRRRGSGFNRADRGGRLDEAAGRMILGVGEEERRTCKIQTRQDTGLGVLPISPNLRGLSCRRDTAMRVSEWCYSKGRERAPRQPEGWKLDTAWAGLGW